MIRRFLLALSWPCFAAALVLALMAAIMLVNRVPDAVGGAVTLGVFAAVAGAVGMGLRFVGGRP
jgi:hypothetical protein